MYVNLYDTLPNSFCNCDHRKYIYIYIYIYSTEDICQYFSVQVTNILKKNETERTEDEISTLHQLPDVVKAAEKNAKRQLKQKERVLEVSCCF